MSKKKKDKIDELTQLSHDLQRVRQESLTASRKGDFRAVARLTCEAARLNRLILTAEGAEVPVLENLGDKLFTGVESNEPEFTFGRHEPDLALTG
jgi:hypothetical protein